MRARVEDLPPTLLIHGWQDEWMRANGVVRLFKYLTRADKKVILLNGSHQISAYHIVYKEQMRWLDHWLKAGAQPSDTVRTLVARIPAETAAPAETPAPLDGARGVASGGRATS